MTGIIIFLVLVFFLVVQSITTSFFLHDYIKQRRISDLIGTLIFGGMWLFSIGYVAVVFGVSIAADSLTP
jgi:RsiW-degrading membrane proteinase PrsW (M82 family)